LRDPQRAISWGTVAAVLVGLVVYLVVPIVLVFNASPEQLVADSLMWRASPCFQR
jgi:hypothetical protein